MDKFSGSEPDGIDYGDVCRRIRQQIRDKLKAQEKPPIERFRDAMNGIAGGQKVEWLDAGTYLQKFRLKQ